MLSIKESLDKTILEGNHKYSWKISYMENSVNDSNWFFSFEETDEEYVIYSNNDNIKSMKYEKSR